MAGPATYNISTIYRTFADAGQAARCHGTAAGRALERAPAAPDGTTGGDSASGRRRSGNAIKIEAAIAQLDQGDAVGGDADLIGDFSLGEVQFLAAVTDEAAKAPSKRLDMMLPLEPSRHSAGLKASSRKPRGQPKKIVISTIYQAVSYSVTREKAPIFTMGSADPRSYSRNKRGIAGSLIWINFDRHALLDLFAKAQGRFLANIDDIRPQFRADSQNVLDQTAIFNSALVRSTNSLTVADTIDNLDNISLTEVSGFKQLASPWYSDQILPFDITLAGTNEMAPLRR